MPHASERTALLRRDAYAFDKVEYNFGFFKRLTLIGFGALFSLFGAGLIFGFASIHDILIGLGVIIVFFWS